MVPELDLCDLEDRQLPSLRDYYSVFSLGTGFTLTQLDTEKARLQRMWHPKEVDRVHHDKPAVVKESIRRRYRELLVVVQKAYKVLSHPRLQEVYEEKRCLKPENAEHMLDKWMLELKPTFRRANELFQYIVPVEKKARCQIPLLDSILFNDTTPARWLFTNKDGFAVSKSGDWSSKMKKDAQKTYSRIATGGLGYMAQFLVHGGDGLTRMGATQKEFESALKGQAAGLTAAQPEIRLKNAASVYRNCYMINKDMQTARRSTTVINNLMPNFGLHQKACDKTAIYEETPSMMTTLNSYLDELTHRLVKHLQIAMSSDSNVRVLRLVVEYVQDAHEQIWVSRIVNMFTHEYEGEVIEHVGHKETSIPEQTLTVWPPHWQVKRSRPAPKMDPPPPRHVRGKKWVDERLTARPFENLRVMREKGAPLLEAAEKRHEYLMYRHASPSGTHHEFQAQRGMFGRKTFSVPAVARNFSDKRWGAQTAASKLRNPDLLQRRFQTSTSLAVNISAAGSPVQDLSKEDCTARDGTMQIWERPKVKPRFKPMTKRDIKEETTDSGMLSEIEAIAEECTFLPEQVHLMYRSFKRHTGNTTDLPGFFTEDQFCSLLAKWGLVKRSVTESMFEAYAKDDELSYADALRVLCGLGCGNRQSQAIALFNICDDDKGGCVTRAELLRFIAGALPEDTSQHKTETFSKVGKLFLLLDDDASGECTKAEFVEGVSNNDSIFRAFGEMNPYRQFFKHWNPNDMTLQNILTAAYYSSDPVEHHNSIRDRVLILADRVDEDGSGRIEFEECLLLVEGMGMDEEDAEREAKRLCGKYGMKKLDFVDMFVEMAESNVKKFQFVERSYGLGGAKGAGIISAPSTRPSTRATNPFGDL